MQKEAGKSTIYTANYQQYIKRKKATTALSYIHVHRQKKQRSAWKRRSSCSAVAVAKAVVFDPFTRLIQ